MTTKTTSLAIVLAAMTGCVEEGPGPNGALTQHPAVSECGGFLGGAKLGDPETYCDAEMLHFAYDVETGVLQLANNRVQLNCCGLHSIRVELVDGVYVLRERDEPEFSDARCGCMCVFDFTTVVEEMPAEAIPVRLERTVTDGEGTWTVWEGTLDLVEAGGSVTIDPTSAYPWCGPLDEV